MLGQTQYGARSARTLNESPSEKEGKSRGNVAIASSNISLNESPSEKEGKLSAVTASITRNGPQ